MAYGEGGAITLTVQLGDGLPAGIVITNTAVISATHWDGEGRNDTSRAGVRVHYGIFLPLATRDV
jgi:hypothetical protein